MIRRSVRALGAPLLCIPLLLAACGGDSAGASKTIKSATSATAVPSNDSSKSPILQPPASRFALSLDDLGTAFITNVPLTFVLDAQNYGKSKTFADGDDGVKLLTEWGYLGGYETSFRPEGNDQAILTNGAFNLAIETHLFKDENGAKKAYDYFEKRQRDGGVQPVNAPQLGNKSSAWKVLTGKIGTSTIDAANHRFIFRRGNLVTIVATLGADGFMDVNKIRDLAAIVDAKALGEREAIAPTPTNNYTPAAAPAKSPTAATTASR